MSKDRRLGRGLAALLGTPLDEHSAAGPETAAATAADEAFAADESDPTAAAPDEEADFEPTEPDDRTSDLLHLNVYEIDDNPFQPRRDFSEAEIASLSESLKEHDMLQPILVRQTGDRYQLISGERRLRAAIQAGWSTVPGRIREADDRLVAELAIVENLQRKDLNAIEKALSFKRYLDEHQCTQDDLARRLKIDRSTIANLMRLLELPPDVLDAVRRAAISAGHARALLPLGEESEQNEFCRRITSDGWSVRETERQVAEAIDQLEGNVLEMTARSNRKRTQSQQVASLEQELRTALGTKVEIRQTNRGRGRIVIHFSNHDEFERLRNTLTDPGQQLQGEAA